MFFKKSKQEADILPPPPPFPKLDLEKLPLIKEKIPKPVEEKPKKSFFETLVLVKTPEEKEAKQRAKEEKRKVKEERKKQKEEEKETLKKQKEEEKIKEKPIPELAIKTEKPPEISQAEQEIEKAIKDLKKKPKKSLFKLFKPKEKLPEIPKKELPPVEIEEPTDDVTAIKHKIHDTRNALMDFDLDKAKIIYIKIMKMYNNLSPEKQARVYEQIRDLYEERKNAESFKTKS